MNEEMRELYQEMILQHKKNPRNFRAIDDPTYTNEGFNPLCGDQITLYVKVEDGKVTDASFQGVGCAISTASASMMTEAVRGKTPAEAEALFEAFRHLVKREGEADPSQLGKLTVFSGVWEFPSRIKCAILPWHSLHAALQGEENAIMTE